MEKNFRSMIKSMLIVGLGGFAGSCLRYLVSIATNSVYCLAFPLATFIVNVLGCLLIGICYGVAGKNGVLSPNILLLLTTGFCGGFTTFSAFANEAWSLSAKGDLLMSVGYLAASVVVGYLCVWLGRSIVS